MAFLVYWLIALPERLTRPLGPVGPLVARLVVGWSFLCSGLWKLNNLASFTNDFVGWGIPAPEIMAPFVATVEFVCAILLIFGLLTRLAAAPLIVVMIVATIVDKAKTIDSIATYTDLIETVYMALFIWLVVAGAGKLSLDHLLLRRRRGSAAEPRPDAVVA